MSTEAMEIDPIPTVPSIAEVSALFTSLSMCTADRSAYCAKLASIAAVCSSSALPAPSTAWADLHRGMIDLPDIKADLQLSKILCDVESLFGPASSSFDQLEYQRMQTHCFDALADICAHDFSASMHVYLKNREMQKASPAASGVFRLIRSALLKFEEISDVNIEHQVAAVRAIWNMSNENLWVQNEFPSAVPSLVPMLSATQYPQLQVQACGALWALCQTHSRTPSYAKPTQDTAKPAASVAEIDRVGREMLQKLLAADSKNIFETLATFLESNNEPKRYVAAGLISAMFSSSALPHAKELVEKLLPTNCTKFLCETVMIGGSATAHREGKGVSLELETIGFCALNNICTICPDLRNKLKNIGALQWSLNAISGTEFAPLRTQVCTFVATICQDNIEHQQTAQQLNMGPVLAFALQSSSIDVKFAALTALSALLSASESVWDRHQEFFSKLQKEIAAEATSDLLLFLSSEFEELWLPVCRLLGQIAYRNAAALAVLLFIEPRKRPSLGMYPKWLEDKYRDLNLPGADIRLPRGALLLNSFVYIASTMHSKVRDMNRYKTRLEQLPNEIAQSTDAGARTVLESEQRSLQSKLSHADTILERVISTQVFALEALVCVLYKSPHMQNLFTSDEQLLQSLLSMFKSSSAGKRVTIKCGAIFAILAQGVGWFEQAHIAPDVDIRRRLIEAGSGAYKLIEQHRATSSITTAPLAAQHPKKPLSRMEINALLQQPLQKLALEMKAQGIPQAEIENRLREEANMLAAKLQQQ